MSRANDNAIFFAIPLDDQERTALTQSLDDAGIDLPSSVVDPRNWHITLSYLGPLGEARVRELTATFSKRAWPTRFKLTMDHLGAFPNAKKTKILWSGLSEGTSEIKKLASELSRELLVLGYPFDRKPFHPHLTLSRPRGTRDTSVLVSQPLRPVEIAVSRFVLFESCVEMGRRYYKERSSFQ